MASKGDIENEKKKQKIVSKYQKKRDELRSIIRDPNKKSSEKMDAMYKFTMLPRNSAKVRLKNRCAITGASRAYFRRFKLGRWVLREYAEMGLIPGLRRYSW
jgi:small subunit ribosomal protein S14